MSNNLQNRLSEIINDLKNIQAELANNELTPEEFDLLKASALFAKTAGKQNATFFKSQLLAILKNGRSSLLKKDFEDRQQIWKRAKRKLIGAGYWEGYSSTGRVSDDPKHMRLTPRGYGYVLERRAFAANG